MKEPKIEISGLAEWAEDNLPDLAWYEIRIHVRKTEDGAEVDVKPDVRLVNPPSRLSSDTITNRN
jgi:hypothetical protein